jgi:HSP20 family protein
MVAWPRWNRLREEMDTVFHRFFREPARWPEPFAAPDYGLETKDAGDTFVVRAEMPGFTPEEVEVKVTGNWLTVYAGHKAAAEEKAASGFAWTEREFHREFMLPEGVEAARAEAKYHQGVLTLKFPKNPAAKTLKIPVKT